MSFFLPLSYPLIDRFFVHNRYLECRGRFLPVLPFLRFLRTYLPQCSKRGPYPSIQRLCSNSRDPLSIVLHTLPLLCPYGLLGWHHRGLLVILIRNQTFQEGLPCLEAGFHRHEYDLLVHDMCQY